MFVCINAKAARFLHVSGTGGSRLGTLDCRRINIETYRVVVFISLFRQVTLC